MLYLIFIRKENPTSCFLSGSFLSMAILSQQFYLSLIPFSLFICYKRTKAVNFTILNPLKCLLHFIPLIAPIILFVYWEGLTHPNYSRHSVAFSLTNITSIITIVGFTFLPVFIFNLGDLVKNKRILYYAPAAVLLTVFFTPVWANGGGAGTISGLTFHSLEIISDYSPAIKYLIQVILILSGFEIIFQLFKIKNQTFLLIVGLFFVGFLFNTVLSERHLLPMILTIYLLVLKNHPKQVLYFWLPAQVALGSVYLYYLFAFNNY
jgi:hypothetical protein